MKQYNRKIEILRAYAILSVVCAHTAVVGENAPASSVVAKTIMSYIAIIGVPIFFFLAGYFHSLSKDSFRVFVKKKLVQIVVPSIFCFTILWLYVVLRKGGVSLESWLSFVVGKESTAYYVVVLLILYLISFAFRKCKIFSIVGIAISILWFPVCKLPFAVVIGSVFMSAYHNILFWLGYFCFGMLVAITDCMEKLFEIARRYLPILMVISLILGVVLYKSEKSPTYFEKYSLAITLIWGLTFVGISALNVYKQQGVGERIGNNSFTIYLTHQLFSGLIIHLSERQRCFAFVALRPVVNIMIVLFMIYVLLIMDRILKGRLSLVRLLVGLKGK